MQQLTVIMNRFDAENAFGLQDYNFLESIHKRARFNWNASLCWMSLLGQKITNVYLDNGTI